MTDKEKIEEEVHTPPSAPDPSPPPPMPPPPLPPEEKDRDEFS